MLILISPAKTLDFDTPVPAIPRTRPALIDKSEQLAHGLRKLSVPKLAKLMGISAELAELNAARFQVWNADSNAPQARPAIHAFNGEMYKAMEAKTWSKDQMAFAQEHVRMLNGFYGLLRPLDGIQPYRLEVATRMKAGKAKNLYEFWRESVMAEVRNALMATGSDRIVNLSSSEYSAMLDFKSMGCRVITPVFKEHRNKEYKVVMTYAKLARGRMVGYLVRSRTAEADGLKAFPEYAYREDLSTDGEWVFVR